MYTRSKFSLPLNYGIWNEQRTKLVNTKTNFDAQHHSKPVLVKF